jgi:hypothetical protein
MGCDIHWFSETRVDGVWQCDQRATYQPDQDYLDDDPDSDYMTMDDFPGRGRDYWLFGLLANGVRTNWPWSFEAKGRPADISDEAGKVFTQWDSDLHSESWLTRAELRAKLTELKHAAAQYLIDPPKDSPVDAPKYLASGLETILANLEVLDTTGNDDDQRIVFGYDN